MNAERSDVPPDHDLISIGEAARRQSVSPKTVRRWIAAGDLPGYRLGPRMLRVRPSDLDQIGRRIPTARSWRTRS